MFYVVKLFSIMLTFFLLLVGFVCGQDRVALQKAEKLYAEKNYEKAILEYSNLLDKNPDLITKAEIYWDLASIYQRLGKYEKALSFYRKIRSFKVLDSEQGKHSAHKLRWQYKPYALKQIGKILYEQEKYEQALLVFEELTSKPRFLFDHMGLQTTEAMLYKAMCLETLERYGEAVEIYFKFNYWRLVEIYEANGQLEDLKKSLSEQDEPLIAKWQKEYKWTRRKAVSELPTKRIHEIIKIYELEKKKDFDSLIKLAKNSSSYENNYKSRLVAHLLVRNRNKVLPKIEQALAKSEKSYVLYTVSGLIGTSETVELLRQNFKEPHDVKKIYSILNALSYAGENGKKALESIMQETSQIGIKDIIQQILKGNKEIFLPDNRIKYPPIPKAKLPKRFRASYN